MPSGSAVRVGMQSAGGGQLGGCFPVTLETGSVWAARSPSFRTVAPNLPNAAAL